VATSPGCNGSSYTGTAIESTPLGRMRSGAFEPDIRDNQIRDNLLARTLPAPQSSVTLVLYYLVYFRRAANDSHRQREIDFTGIS
jgi:hypothetical protein